MLKSTALAARVVSSALLFSGGSGGWVPQKTPPPFLKRASADAPRAGDLVPPQDLLLGLQHRRPLQDQDLRHEAGAFEGNLVEGNLVTSFCELRTCVGKCGWPHVLPLAVKYKNTQLRGN